MQGILRREIQWRNTAFISLLHVSLFWLSNCSSSCFGRQIEHQLCINKTKGVWKVAFKRGIKEHVQAWKILWAFCPREAAEMERIKYYFRFLSPRRLIFGVFCSLFAELCGGFCSGFVASLLFLFVVVERLNRHFFFVPRLLCVRFWYHWFVYLLFSSSRLRSGDVKSWFSLRWCLCLALPKKGPSGIN